MSAVSPPPDQGKYRGRWALKPKRNALGTAIPGRFVPYWGGRKVSKYDPVVEDAKHARAKAQGRAGK
jgi:hypothetical protein